MKHLRTTAALGIAAALIAVCSASAAAESVYVAASPAPMLTSPVQPVEVARLFDPPPERWNAGHRGIDLRTQPSAAVYSPAAGVVAFSGVVVNRPVVSIDLDNGLRSSVEPVVGTVAVGTRVGRGEVVGVVADDADSSHCAPAWCAHWGLRDGEDYVNPLDWLEGFGPIRLLPLG